MSMSEPLQPNVSTPKQDAGAEPAQGGPESGPDREPDVLPPTESAPGDPAEGDIEDVLEGREAPSFRTPGDGA